jgi:membrane protease YdiL (CAAX protease family)
VLVVVAINAYYGTIRSAHQRAGLGPSRPYMYLRAMLFEFVVLAIVVLGVRIRGGSLQAIFGQHWHSLGQLVTDLGLGVSLLLASTVVASMSGSHQREGSADDSIRYLLPQTSNEIMMWMALSITAGICEEAIYRGYLQRQLTGLTRSVAAGIVLSAAAFGAAHAYQGPQRASVIATSALLFGLLAQWRRSVRPGMIAHSLQDAVAPLLVKLMRH